jgi:hypothetical protein
MVQLLLIGLGAGAASALLFASVASGSLLSILLFYLAPLPIIIAALGWSHWSALVAALAAAIGLSFAFGSFFIVAFMIGVGLPAWWLGYLALLARPSADAPDGVEWYPAGHLVLWAAIAGALVVIAAIPNFGMDEEAFRAGLRNSFERVLKAQGHVSGDVSADLNVDSQRIVDVLAMVIPPAAAVLATLTNTINLWLAGRIVSVSGHLRRPWPDLPGLRFPSYAPALLAAALAASFLPNLLGTVGTILTASLLMAYAILGLAVLHTITRGAAGRGLILASTYVAIFLLFWPILLLTLTGLADTAFDLRGRLANRNLPPPMPGGPT